MDYASSREKSEGGHMLHVTQLYESNIDLSSPALENGWCTVRKMDVAM